MLIVKIGENFTVAIRTKDSHLQTGFVPMMTERFQFVLLTTSALGGKWKTVYFFPCTTFTSQKYTTIYHRVETPLPKLSPNV